MTDKERIKDLEQHVSYIEDKKNREIEKLKKLYYEKVVEIKNLRGDVKSLEIGIEYYEGYDNQMEAERDVARHDRDKLKERFDDESVRQYQLGWVSALERVIEIGDVSKGAILHYCEGKIKDIESEL